MNFIIRQEHESDYKLIENVVKSAFASATYSEGSEHHIIRNHNTFPS